MADNKDVPTSSVRGGSLRAPLLLAHLLLFAALGTLAYFANQKVVLEPLQEQADALQDSSQRQLLSELRAPAQLAEQFTLALAGVARAQWGDEAAVRRLGEAVLGEIPADSPIVAAGIWPEPGRFSPGTARKSFYWTLGDALRFHGDYNDPANIAYHGEIWYSPTRYFRGQGCYWTSRYTEPFLRRPVVSCAVPLREGDNWLGVASVVIDVSRLTGELPSLNSRQTFYLLLDRDSQILAGAGLPLESDDNMADLARREPALGPVAVQIHELGEELIRAARQAREVDAAMVDELVRQSRQMPRIRAQLLLASLRVDPPPGRQEMTLSGGAPFDSGVRVDIQSVSPGQWTLLTGREIAPRIAGFSTGQWLAATSTAGAVLLALLMSYALSMRTLLRPLSRLLEQLQRPAEDTVLESTGEHELARLTQLINRRHEQIRKLLEKTRQPRYEWRERQAGPATQPGETVESFTVLDALADPVIVTDSDGRIQHFNRAAESLCGWNLAQARTLPFEEVFHILDRQGKARIEDLAQQTLESGERSEHPIPAMFKTRSGHELPIAVTTSPIFARDETLQGSLILLSDARSPAAADTGGQLQVRDQLTGCLNRQAFEAELANRCEAVRLGGASAFSMLYLDIDHMQRINDRCGTEGGDELLRQVSRLFQNDVGEKNPVYRLHADKFAVLLATGDRAEAQVTAELLRADVQSWGFLWKGEKLDVSISASLVLVDRDSGRPLDILRSAQELCEQAKSEGRGRVVSGKAEPRRGAAPRDDKHWLSLLKRGLAEDRFHLSTQQLRSLQRRGGGGQVFATMLRLEDDEGFWAGSDAFMPIAERHNMAEQLDRWVIEQVFQRLASDEALSEGLELCMIPLTRGSLQNPAFLDFVLESFQEENVPPHKICFDLNERDVHARLSSARDFARALSQAGCQICLSGISTGPASYRLIKEIPAGLIRMDPQLTRDADRDPVSRLAMESLHKIGHTLDKRSIIDRVDRQELLRVAQGLGIDFAQGDAVARVTPILFQARA